MSDIKLRMPRDKWKAIQDAKRDVRRAELELSLARGRVREAIRAAQEHVSVSR